MIRVNSKKRGFSKFWRKILLIFRQLSQLEKRAVVILLATAIISCVFILRDRLYKNEVPLFGGTLVEGTLDSSQSDLSESLGRLTKIGLTKFDNKGNIIPDLAESWQISPDGLSYTFKLRNFAKSDDVISKIREEEKEWDDVKISKIDDSQIKFELKQPLGPFLTHTTEPIFSYGPYKTVKTSKTEIILESNKDYWETRPYINKIVFKLYSDPKTLEAAIKNKKVMGALLPGDNIKGYRAINLTLPKYKMVFFNTANPDLANKDIRKQIAQNQKLGKELNLRMAVTANDSDMQLAGDLSQKWSELGVKLEVVPYDTTEIQKRVIPNHDYDVILYGINYGEEEDPYPFFHSSQVSADGLNLSQFSNSQADKILEEARFMADPILRKQKYEEFKKIFNDEAPAIIVEQDNINYFISDKVKGIDSDIYPITAGDRFASISHWYLKTKKIK